MRYMTRKMRVADLFCGAGGTSTGVAQACLLSGHKLELTAVNHWQRAVETHAANHPDAAHHCEDLSIMDPRKAVPGGKLDLLVASPECTHHSVARGGMPVSDQSRASAWCVLRWCTALTVDRVLIENVPEFLTWGPIGANGRPLSSRRGETFHAFVNALKSTGYRVDWRILNSADYGAATSRRRFFLQAVRGRREIIWPDATHAPDGDGNLFGTRKPWRGAKEIIDWNLLGSSIFNRRRPLSANTMARIEAGLRKFGGKNADPFLVLLRGTDACQVKSSARSLDDPAPAITTSGGHIGLCEPFIVTANHGADAFGGGHERRSHSINRPLGTVLAGGKSHALVQPALIQLTHGGRVLSIDDPLPTVTTAKRGEIAIVQPFMVPYYGACTDADCIDAPVRTLTTKDRLGVVEPLSGQKLDILFRMLQPHELAAAMGFPRDYRITGNRGEQVKQIGNAVEVNQARELVKGFLAP